jgi:hypothetical protein
VKFSASYSGSQIVSLKVALAAPVAFVALALAAPPSVALVALADPSFVVIVTFVAPPSVSLMAISSYSILLLVPPLIDEVPPTSAPLALVFPSIDAFAVPPSVVAFV